MAGIYVHIPFCKSRCAYCAFYSTTAIQMQRRYVDAVCREYALRRGELTLPVTTVYIGGGTPSTLPTDCIEQLFDTLGSAGEVTMECNPDDVTDSFCNSLKGLPVNRVSMGAQTFNDERLRFIGRRHTAQQVTMAVERLRKAGIDNISIDLMYGFPRQTLHDWEDDISHALALGVEHLSAYALTYEEQTPLYRMVAEGSITPTDEELSRAMYYTLKDRTEAAGYEHYEISNFARTGRRSRHNSGYWNHTPYIGLGAAAHSFDGERRKWNIGDLLQYMLGIESGKPVSDSETLSGDTRYNDIVMTALRTAEGLHLTRLSHDERQYCLNMAQRYTTNGLLCHDTAKDRLRLTREGLFVSDMILTDLMKVP